jgi:DNA-binding GntR family transcriptional regulator
LGVTGAQRGGKQSLADQVYQGLREEILSCRIRPGEPLAEGEVAKRFHVSKTPVREALGRLAQEGLVEVLPRKGYYITPITVRDVLDGYHLREVLEGEACALAAERLTSTDLLSLDELCDYGPDRAPTDNRKFHTIIALGSGNQRLAKLVAQVLDEMQRMVILDPYMSYVPEDGATEHQDIVAALRARDPALARRHMSRHIKKSLERVLRQF